MFKKILFIINPAAGKKESIVQTLFKQLSEVDIMWDIKVSRTPEDIPKIIKEAIEEKVEVVAVYGGDGTVLGVVREILGTDIVLGILPGGSANILSKTLGIPQNLKDACQLICSKSASVQPVDIGKFNDQYFLTRICLGLEADVVRATERHMQNKFGMLAYGFSTVKALRKIKKVKYHLKIDGKDYVEEGIACFIANSCNVGFVSVDMVNNSSVTDSRLDVIVVPVISRMFYFKAWFKKNLGYEKKGLLKRWSAQKVEVINPSKQTMHCDGEICQSQDVKAEIIPNRLNVIVHSKNFKVN